MEWTLPLIICLSVSFIMAYLLGSCNFAIIITRIFANDDIRNHGSGNAGLTNVLRTLGKGPALLIVSVILVRLLLHYFANVDELILGDYLVAYAALLGHVFPIFYGFKGGKGILVSFGALMILSPIAGIMCFSGFLITVIISRYVSLGSIVAGVLYPLSIMSLRLMQGNSMPYFEIILTLPISILIIYMHRQNIARLIKHEENKISFKKKIG